MQSSVFWQISNTKTRYLVSSLISLWTRPLLKLVLVRKALTTAVTMSAVLTYCTISIRNELRELFHWSKMYYASGSASTEPKTGIRINNV